MFSSAKKKGDTVTISHVITDRKVTTTVKLPGQRAISKTWAACDGGAVGRFKQDWNEDRRLDGWQPVIDAARNVPDFL